MKKILDYRSWGTDGVALLLRLLFGGLFMYHGYQKIAGYDTILPHFKDFIGIGARLSFKLVIFAEFFCGFLVVIGFLTRFALVPIFITMIVAYFIAHAGAAFGVRQMAFIYLVLCIVIFILGPGKYAVDRYVFRPRP